MVHYGSGAIGQPWLVRSGRLDGTINSGGETVFPEMIEAGLAGLHGPEAVLVVGVEDVCTGDNGWWGLYRGMDRLLDALLASRKI